LGWFGLTKESGDRNLFAGSFLTAPPLGAMEPKLSPGTFKKKGQNHFQGVKNPSKTAFLAHVKRSWFPYWMCKKIKN
jgi:hypothetical protein